ncbi:MAG: hypothetical protein Q8S73_20295 [Deltaproteobacteria bacterium]|nr:hypothetical protein [Myxococcales bacterium]MDP3216460.1 hypothetical protein [Deltaproteobacteria bacterium]
MATTSGLASSVLGAELETIALRFAELLEAMPSDLLREVLQGVEGPARVMLKEHDRSLGAKISRGTLDETHLAGLRLSLQKLWPSSQGTIPAVRLFFCWADTMLPNLVAAPFGAQTRGFPVGKRLSRSLKNAEMSAAVLEAIARAPADPQNPKDVLLAAILKARLRKADAAWDDYLAVLRGADRPVASSEPVAPSQRPSPDMPAAVASQPPPLSRPDAPSPTSSPEVPVALPSDATPWREVIELISRIPAEAPEWDAVQQLADAVDHLAGQKLEERDTERRGLAERLRRLSEQREILSSFEAEGILDWSFSPLREDCRRASDLVDRISDILESRRREPMMPVSRLVALGAELTSYKNELETFRARAPAPPVDSPAEVTFPAGTPVAIDEDDCEDECADSLGPVAEGEEPPPLELWSPCSPEVSEPPHSSADDIPNAPAAESIRVEVAPAEHTAEPTRVEALPAEPSTPDEEVSPSSYWSATSSSADTARLVLDPAGPVDAPLALAWSLLRDGDLGLARQVAVASQGLSSQHLDALPALLVQWLGLSQVLGTSLDDGIIGEIEFTASSLRERIDGLSSHPGANHRAAALLAFAACVRPALLLPDSIAAESLRQLRIAEPYTEVDHVREVIVQFGGAGLTLTSSVVATLVATDSGARLRVIAGRARAVQETKRSKRFRFQRATWIWQRWMQRGGFLDGLLDLIAVDRVDQATRLSQEAQAWRDDAVVLARIHDWDQRNNPSAAKTDPIHGRALQDMKEEVSDVVGLVDEWLAEVGRPRGGDQRHDERHRVYRNKLQGLLPRARRCLAEALGPIDVTAAAKTALQALDAVAVALGGDSPPAQHSRRSLFGAPLLGIEGLDLGDDWLPVGPVGALERDAIARHVVAGKPNLVTRFEECMNRHDHQATGRILSALEDAGEASQDGVARRRRRADALTSRRIALAGQIQGILAEIERAVLEDLCDDDERAGWEAKLRFDEVDEDSVRLLSGEIERIRRTVSERRQARIDTIRREIELLPREIAAGDRARIERALAQQDIIVTEEYLAQVARDGALFSEVDERDIFAEFFPGFIERWNGHLAAAGRTSLGNPEIEAVGAGRDPIAFGGIVPDRSRSGQLSNALRAWIQLSTRVGSRPDGIGHVLEAIGFEQASVDAVPDGARGRRGQENLQVFDVNTKPVQDRRRCPVHQLGSAVSGRYRIICLWDRPTPSEIVSTAAAALDHSRGTIVMYLGTMQASERRSLAEACRESRTRLILLDEALFVFVTVRSASAGAMLQDTRLAVLFASTLPFTIAEPYTTTAGYVPPETFYGRADASRQVFEPHGTCLVFGGRQLGKTALLRHVERSSNNPQRGVIVRFIDLQSAGVGEAVPPADLPRVIVEALRDDELQLDRITSWDGLITRLSAWLNAEKTRRIVLLLDEADRFLAADASGDSRDGHNRYANLVKLKELMEVTDRRFKVVFAGLHNVQRTARDPNSPIAHLGTPLCVGPLLDDGEAREAMRLVIEPLRSLGYRFESNDVVTRILGHTNWYPSLIQLFCQQLLAHLQSPDATFDGPAATPPYRIRAKDVERAYRTGALRKAIFERFTWTLNLDSRYRVLALCVALLLKSEERDLTISQIRDEALYWWERGFRQDSSNEAFETLLDEMVGLGLLRLTGPQRYALRSANVVNLLGSVEDGLLDAARRDPTPEYEPHAFHRTGNEPWKRSPLTARQESQILDRTHGAVVLFGARLAEINDLDPWLRAMAPSERLALMFFGPEGREAGGAVDFQTWLRKVADSRTKGSRRAENREKDLLLVVRDAIAWDPSWVAQASELLSNLKTRDSYVRVLFVGSPEHAWDCMGVENAGHLLGTASVLTLGPWSELAVRRWQLDLGIGVADDACLRDIIKATGGWGTLLHRFGQRLRHNTGRWRVELDALAEEVGSGSYLRLFAIPGPAEDGLRAMAEYRESITSSDLVKLVDDLEPATAHRVLSWASLVRFVSEDQDGWRLDPLLERLLVVPSAE